MTAHVNGGNGMAERKFDKVFGAVIWGFMLFVVPFLTVWWTVYSLTKDEWMIGMGCIFGAAAGVFINILLLKKLAAHPYSQKPWVSVLMLVLYSVGIFGFFMGVPVFNILAGALAAVYVGRQAKILGWDPVHFSSQLKRAQRLLFLVLLFLCAASAYLALSDTHTAANLEGMFSLGFSLTPTMLAAIILAGGALLLAFQAVLVKALASKAYRN
jgi:Co/Zn/Cd efflux system component